MIMLLETGKRTKGFVDELATGCGIAEDSPIVDYEGGNFFYRVARMLAIAREDYGVPRVMMLKAGGQYMRAYPP